ncbi:MAG: hypothetical protein P8176_01740 [Gammaproteobacteria bacterium]
MNSATFYDLEYQQMPEYFDPQKAPEETDAKNAIFDRLINKHIK